MDFAKLFERNDVTDAEWQEALEAIEAAESKQWSDFLKRQEDHDDAFYSKPWESRFYRYVARKGRGLTYRLADMQGNLVDSKIVDGKFGEVWLVKKTDGSVEWVNVSSAEKFSRQQAHYNKKGYQLVQCEVKVRVDKSGEPYLNMDEVISVEVCRDE